MIGSCHGHEPNRQAPSFPIFSPMCCIHGLLRTRWTFDRFRAKPASRHQGLLFRSTLHIVQDPTDRFRGWKIRTGCDLTWHGFLSDQEMGTVGWCWDFLSLMLLRAWCTLGWKYSPWSYYSRFFSRSDLFRFLYVLNFGLQINFNSSIQIKSKGIPSDQASVSGKFLDRLTTFHIVNYS